MAEVVPRVIDLLDRDPSPDIRHKTIPILLRLADRDPRANAAVEQASRQDPDKLVRHVATLALAGGHVRARKAYQRATRRTQRDER